MNPSDGLARFRGIHRLHPTSILFGMLVVIRKFFLAMILAVFLASSGNQTVLLFTAIALVVTLLRETLQYLTLGYEIANGELKVDQGWLFRRHRTVPISRIQNIDQLQNPIHRLWGVVEVRVETASGKEPEAILRVIKVEDLEALRAAIFGLTKPTSDVTGEQAPAGPERSVGEVSVNEVEPGIAGDRGDAPGAVGPSNAVGPDVILTISPWVLARYGLVSLRGFVIIPFAFGIFAETTQDGPARIGRLIQRLPGMVDTWGGGVSVWWLVPPIMVLIAVGSAVWFMLRFYDYQMTRCGDDLRVTCGWFTRVSATIPRHRIQLISIQRTWWARVCGLATIRVETASGSGSGKQNDQQDSASMVARRWFVPAMPFDDVSRLLAELRPGIGDWDEFPWQPTAKGTRRRLVRLAILKALAIGGLGAMVWGPVGGVAGLATALILVPYAWRRASSMQVAVTPELVAYQSGILTRKRSLCFLDKVQTLRLKQSPMDRRWGMASLEIDTAGAGPAGHRIAARYLNAATAASSAAQVSDRAGQLGYSG